MACSYVVEFQSSPSYGFSEAERKSAKLTCEAIDEVNAIDLIVLSLLAASKRLVVPLMAGSRRSFAVSSLMDESGLNLDQCLS